MSTRRYRRCVEPRGRRVYLLPPEARKGAHLVTYAEQVSTYTWCIIVRHMGPRTKHPKRFNVNDYPGQTRIWVEGSAYLAFKLEAARLRKLLGRRRRG